jgi:hypothetical protein
MIFNHNGLHIIGHIPAWGDAGQKLEELGIKFDSVIRTVDQYQTIYGQEKKKYGIHVYFMFGKCDVAYWTEGMYSLAIHSTPRPWGKTLIDNTEVMPYAFNI